MSKAEVIYEKVRALPDVSQAAVLREVELLIEGDVTASPAERRPSDLARKFTEMAETWRRETAFLSFAEQRAMHPAYQRIIGMGWPAVPLILAELERQPEHWLWALRAITGENPALGTNNLRGAVEAWLRWGRERNLLFDAKRGHST